MATKKLTDADVKNAKAKAGARLELWDSQTPGLCLRVSAGRKVWLVRYRADGKQRRYVFGEYPGLDLADARVEAAALMRAARKDGADPAADKRRTRAETRAQPIKTYRDLAGAYMQACRDGHWQPRGKRQSDRTLQDAQESLDRYVLPELGDLKLAEVTRPVVRKFLRGLADRGICAQANKALAVVRQSYAYAIAEFEGKLIAVNVAAGQTRQRETPRSRTMTDAELKVFWAALKAPANVRAFAGPDDQKGRPVLSGSMAILLQLAVLLLQRRIELAGMMASELDLDQGLWLIAAERMKARKAHLVPLPPEAVKLIRQALALAEAARPVVSEGEKRSNDFPIFPSTHHPSRHIRPGSVTHAMKDVATALGLERVTPHDLRRTGATALTSERLGVSPFIRSLVIAHTTDTGGGAAISRQHYDVNTYVREKRAALAGWESLVLELTGEKPRASNGRSMWDVA